MIGVYKITNPAGKIYVGSSKEVEVRFKRYKKLQCKAQPKLYNSLKKYGPENHIFEIITECKELELFKLENYYGLQNNCLDRNVGLNLLLPGIDDIKIIISKENRETRSKSRLGKKATEEAKINMSLSQLGRKHSTNTKEKMRLSNKNTKLVLNTETGIYYYGCKEAGESMNIHNKTLRNKLNGSKKNNTKFIYV